MLVEISILKSSARRNKLRLMKARREAKMRRCLCEGGSKGGAAQNQSSHYRNKIFASSAYHGETVMRIFEAETNFKYSTFSSARHQTRKLSVKITYISKYAALCTLLHQHWQIMKAGTGEIIKLLRRRLKRVRKRCVAEAERA